MRKGLLIHSALIVTMLSGCGSGTPEPLGTVNGNVKFNGETVTRGSVIIQREDSPEAIRAHITADGEIQVQTYARRGLPPGRYRVRYVATPRPAPSVEEAGMVVGESVESESGEHASTNDAGDAQFSEPRPQSGAELTIDVSEGENQVFMLNFPQANAESQK